MAAIDPLFDCLDAIQPISESFREFLLGAVQPAEYRRGRLLLREGTVCNRIWWLRKGLVRFYYQHGAEEVSHCFVPENNIILAIRSINEQQRSRHAIQALENCSTWFIDAHHLPFIYMQFTEAQIIGRKTAELYYHWLEQRLTAIALQKSVDRYRYLETQLPDLLKRVSLKHLASFLDMDAHTISRMRRGKNH